MKPILRNIRKKRPKFKPYEEKSKTQVKDMKKIGENDSNSCRIDRLDP